MCWRDLFPDNCHIERPLEAPGQCRSYALRSRGLLRIQIPGATS